MAVKTVSQEVSVQIERELRTQISRRNVSNNRQNGTFQNIAHFFGVCFVWFVGAIVLLIGAAATLAAIAGICWTIWLAGNSISELYGPVGPLEDTNILIRTETNLPEWGSDPLNQHSIKAFSG